MPTNAQTQRVLEQIENRIKEAFLAVNTFDEVDTLQNHFDEYIAAGIRKMAESKVWEDREISHVKSFAENTLHKWLTITRSRITATTRANWEF